MVTGPKSGTYDDSIEQPAWAGILLMGWLGSGSIGIDHGIGNISTLQTVMLNSLDGFTIDLNLMLKWPRIEILILQK